MDKNEISLLLLLRYFGYDEKSVIDMIDDFKGRLMIQKIVYISLVGGVDIGYSFTWNKHGPDSSRLTRAYNKILNSFMDGDRDYTEYEFWRSARRSLNKIKPLIVDNPLEEKGISKYEWLEIVSSILFWSTLYNNIDYGVEKVKELKLEYKDMIEPAKNEIVKYFPAMDQVLIV
ncbi:hypothetical protein [Methanolacinia paynteri]|uniref:hypothetical protein n=1 Tax=Methanolacinia paynteri TaxID=230356 RepID=UPI00064E2F4E|nr:hypothetical protein [Methanolacinia paynteri]